MADNIDKAEEYKYITFGTDKLERSLWHEPMNYNGAIKKPFGGLWACRYTPNEEYMSPWHEWCENEEFNIDKLNTAVILNILDDAKIYTIDSVCDLDKLHHDFGLVNNDNNIPKSILSNMLDFEKIAKEYDGIYLTEKGQWSTRFSRPYNLYGWDVESLLILNFNIITNQKNISIDIRREN